MKKNISHNRPCSKRPQLSVYESCLFAEYCCKSLNMNKAVGIDNVSAGKPYYRGGHRRILCVRNS
ncbi:MAG: hypothetical protein KAS13_03625 [Candidatus Omnitrophica bacterium]|nr:hypothetical protein [Candidatus Omnitrophota bacterium]